MDTPENNQGQGGTNTPDPINNIKQEFGRKLGNVESQVAALAETNKQLLAQLQSLSQANKPQTNEKSIDDLWYQDPSAAAAVIEERTTKKIEERLAANQQRQQKETATISQLTREYPELNDESNPLTKKAVEIYMSLDASDRSSPTAYRLAVKEAAAELGVKPINKRTDEDLDSYSIGSAGASTTGRTARGKKDDELDEKTLAFAKLLGRPVDDPKYIESLKQTSKRKTWTKYE